MGVRVTLRRVNAASGRIGRWLLGSTIRVSPGRAWVLIAAALVACWTMTNALGGAAKIPPHCFYVPILFAGIRFGATAALATGCVSVILSGPLSYADVATRTPQEFADWGTRGLFFLVIGQALTAIATLTAASLAGELEDLRRARSLWSALDQEQFRVHYQPIVSMADGGRVVGAEALLRLHDPERGIVGPDEFIPLAETTGLIRPLGSWALREACAQAVRWRAESLIGSDFMLSVNVSARELDAPAFVERVAGVLAETGLTPGCLHLEITETALADDPRRFIDALHDLRRLGVALALDDFGTGHSTLTQVQQLPVDLIKIDRSFVATLGHGEQGSAIADNVLSLARSLRLVTIAEGVETLGQATILRSLGCDLAQGYLYGRPVPSEDFSLVLLSERQARGREAARAELPNRIAPTSWTSTT